MKIHITHNDLDGVGCAVVSKVIYPDIKIIHATYANFAEKLREALKRNPELLIISDVWSNELSADIKETFINHNAPTLIYDHHVSSYNSQKKIAAKSDCITLIHDSKICATKIIWKYFSLDDNVHKRILHLSDMVEAVNVFDTSGTIDGIPGDLNTLFWERSITYMKNMLKRIPFRFTNAELNTINKIKNNRQSYFNRVIGKAKTNGELIILQANKHRDFIFQTLLRDFSCVIINSKTTDSVSIRSVDGKARILAEKLHGGGHPNAAGVSKYYNNRQLMRVYKRISR